MHSTVTAPVIILMLALPLIFGWIPPNRLYGFRTAKTLSSPTVWYPANRASAFFLVIASLVSLLAMFGLRGTAWSPENSQAALLAIVVGPLAIALASSFLYLRKL